MVLHLQDADPDASGTQSLRSFTASMQRKEKAAQSKDSAVSTLMNIIMILDDIKKFLKTAWRLVYQPQLWLCDIGWSSNNF